MKTSGICFVCGSKGANCTLHVKPRNKGSYFSFLENHDPPKGAKLPNGEGVVSACLVCYAFLNQQWDSFEKTKTPLIKRLYWLKRVDNRSFTGAELNVQGEYVAQIMGVQYNCGISSGNDASPFDYGNHPGISCGLKAVDGPSSRNESDRSPPPGNPNDVEALDLSLSPKKSKGRSRKLQKWEEPTGESGTKLANAVDAVKVTKHKNIVCYVCSNVCPASLARFVYAIKYTDDEPYFPFILGLMEPPGAMALTKNGVTQVCSECRKALNRQWRAFELRKVPENDRVYRINDLPIAAEKTTKENANCLLNDGLIVDPGRKDKESMCYLCGEMTSLGSLRAISIKGGDFGEEEDGHTLLPFTEKMNCLRGAQQANSSSSSLSGVVLVCLLCHGHFISQWRQFENNNLPSEHRKYILRPPLQNGCEPRKSPGDLPEPNQRNESVTVEGTKALFGLSELTQQHSKGVSETVKKSERSGSGILLSVVQQLQQQQEAAIAAGKSSEEEAGLKMKTSSSPVLLMKTDCNKNMTAQTSYLTAKDKVSSPSSLSSSEPDKRSASRDGGRVDRKCDCCYLCGHNSETSEGLLRKTMAIYGSPLSEFARQGDEAVKDVDSKVYFHRPFFPFLAGVMPSGDTRSASNDGRVDVCYVCYHNLITQWSRFEKSKRIEDQNRWKRTYRRESFTCADCRRSAERQKVDVFPVGESSRLRSNPEDLVTIEGKECAVLCSSCRFPCPMETNRAMKKTVDTEDDSCEGGLDKDGSEEKRQQQQQTRTKRCLQEADVGKDQTSPPHLIPQQQQQQQGIFEEEEGVEKKSSGGGGGGGAVAAGADRGEDEEESEHLFLGGGSSYLEALKKLAVGPGFGSSTCCNLLQLLPPLDSSSSKATAANSSGPQKDGSFSKSKTIGKAMTMIEDRSARSTRVTVESNDQKLHLGPMMTEKKFDPHFQTDRLSLLRKSAASSAKVTDEAQAHLEANVHLTPTLSRSSSHSVPSVSSPSVRPANSPPLSSATNGLVDDDGERINCDRPVVVHPSIPSQPSLLPDSIFRSQLMNGSSVFGYPPPLHPPPSSFRWDDYLTMYRYQQMMNSFPYSGFFGSPVLHPLLASGLSPSLPFQYTSGSAPFVCRPAFDVSAFLQRDGVSVGCDGQWQKEEEESGDSSSQEVNPAKEDGQENDISRKKDHPFKSVESMEEDEEEEKVQVKKTEAQTGNDLNPERHFIILEKETQTKDLTNNFSLEITRSESRPTSAQHPRKSAGKQPSFHRPFLERSSADDDGDAGQGKESGGGGTPAGDDRSALQLASAKDADVPVPSSPSGSSLTLQNPSCSSDVVRKLCDIRPSSSEGGRRRNGNRSGLPDGLSTNGVSTSLGGSSDFQCRDERMSAALGLISLCSAHGDLAPSAAKRRRPSELLEPSASAAGSAAGASSRSARSPPSDVLQTKDCCKRLRLDVDYEKSLKDAHNHSTGNTEEEEEEGRRSRCSPSPPKALLKTTLTLSDSSTGGVDGKRPTFQWPGVEALIESYQQHRQDHAFEKQFLLDQESHMNSIRQHLLSSLETFSSKITELTQARHELEREKVHLQASLDALTSSLNHLH